MPRDGSIVESDTYRRPQETSQVHSSIIGATSGGAPLVAPASRASEAVRWMVMVLAVLVFLYAAFLVWQLLEETEPAGSVSPATAPSVERVEEQRPLPSLPELDAARPEPATPASTEKPAAEAPPDRKSRPRATRSRRRRNRNETSAKPEPSPPAAKQAPAPEALPRTPVDPVDIDIANPYRN
jgi:hypothetical protein